MLKRFKEIWYGAATGAGIWALDALMHIRLQGHLGLRPFITELFSRSSGQLAFRLVFVLIAAAFGYLRWRSNRRERQMQNMQLVVSELHREISRPLMLIVGYSQMLSLKEGWPVTREVLDAARTIQLNAEKLNSVLRQLPPPGAAEISSSAEVDEIKLSDYRIQAATTRTGRAVGAVSGLER